MLFGLLILSFECDPKVHHDLGSMRQPDYWKSQQLALEYPSLVAYITELQLVRH